MVVVALMWFACHCNWRILFSSSSSSDQSFNQSINCISVIINMSLLVAWWSLMMMISLRLTEILVNLVDQLLLLRWFVGHLVKFKFFQMFNYHLSVVSGGFLLLMISYHLTKSFFLKKEINFDWLIDWMCLV